MSDLKIAIAGTGYVGLSIATLLAQHNKVTAVDIVPDKVAMINKRKSPIQDDYVEKYLAEDVAGSRKLDLAATLDAEAAYSNANFVVIAAPTNYDSKKNHFDTSAVEAVIKLVIRYNPDAVMVIKSTIPVGFTASVREKYHCDNIIFSPEFLRVEGPVRQFISEPHHCRYGCGECQTGEGCKHICWSVTRGSNQRQKGSRCGRGRAGG